MIVLVTMRDSENLTFNNVESVEWSDDFFGMSMEKANIFYINKVDIVLIQMDKRLI